MTRLWRAVTAVPLVAALAATAPSAAAQDLAPGEETVFTVSYLNIPTGEGRIRVGNAEGDIWPVILQARTSGAIRMLDIREHLVSYWDARRRLSRGSDLQAFEAGDSYADSARFDAAARKVTLVEQRYGHEREETVLDVPEGALDLLGAFVWLRLQELEVGRQFEIHVVAGKSQSAMLAEVTNREVVRTPAGEFPSFKIRVHTAFAGKFSARRDMALWLADSAGHHLVRASAEFALGSIVAELKSYHLGGQVAAAE